MCLYFLKLTFNFQSYLPQALNQEMSLKPRKRVAIIGAGVSGITTAKCVLEEDPEKVMEVIVYERSKHTGGLWRFIDDDDDAQKAKENGNALEDVVARDDTATVMHSTVINSGKEVSAFSDFPPPASAPNFMHNSQMVRLFYYLLANK